MNTAAHNIQSAEKKRIVSLRVTVTFSLFFVGRFVRIQSLTNSNKLTIQLQAALCPRCSQCWYMFNHLSSCLDSNEMQTLITRTGAAPGVNGSILILTVVINLYLDTRYTFYFYS